MLGIDGLSALDWAAFAWFLVGWLVYAAWADRRRRRSTRYMALYQQHHRAWLEQLMARERGIIDTHVIAAQMRHITFYATTTILVLGGLVALLGAADLGSKVLATLPFAVAPSPAFWTLKVAILLVVFASAFFKFTWALRLSYYKGVLISGAPTKEAEAAEKDAFLARAEALTALIAKHFLRGERAYYFGLAALGWFVNPWLFIATTTWVVAILHRRDFHSATVRLLSKGSG